jgi:hypothetical protein
VLAATAVEGDQATLRAQLTAREATFVVAEAAGPSHGEVLADETFAHTSAVYVDVDAKAVARRADAGWCLDWIDRFERLVRRDGRFERPAQLDDLLAVCNQARAVYRAVA